MWWLYKKTEVCWSSDYIGGGLHKPLCYHLKEQLWEHVWCLKPVWENMRCCCVKRGCSAQRVGTCPSACLLPIVVSPHQWQINGCQLWTEGHIELVGGENIRVPVTAEMQLSVCGQKRLTEQKTAEMSLWMLSLSVLCQVLHWAVKLCTAITQCKCCYHDKVNTIFVVCLMDFRQRFSILWPERWDTDWWCLR